MKDREAQDQDEAVAATATSLLTEDGEPMTCPPENCVGKFNLLKLPLYPSYRKKSGGGCPRYLICKLVIGVCSRT